MKHPIIIEVKNIGKKYTINHQRGGYVALRDVLMGILKSPFAFIKTKAKQAVGLETKEDFWALKDVNFTVNKGEVIGIIGRNGAGKSTLLKILSQITPPTTGEIKINGTVGSLLEVGTGFHPELTGRENIFLNGAILGMPKKEIVKKFDAIVEFAGIDKFLDTPVKHYSSGMYVRLAFSVAAHMEPDILIIDEVLAVGDAEFQKKCLGKMEDITKSEGRTILFVSHNMDAIRQLCQKCLLLENGKIIDAGKTKEVIEKYTSSTVFESKVDLTKKQHSDRPKEYGSLTELYITNNKMEPCNIFTMGDTIIFKLSLNCKNFLEGVELGIKISGNLGAAIHYYTSTWEGLNLDLKPGNHSFEIIVRQIYLFPGKYIIGAWLSKSGYLSDDSIQNITMIEIVSGDITGHPANFDKYAYSGGEVYSPSKWELLTNK
jgi:lipopolysaccharide transport system ATP-binding protein